MSCKKCKKRKRFRKSTVYRLKDACADDNVDDRGGMLKGEDKWTELRDVFVYGNAVSGSERETDHQKVATTRWKLEIKNCGLDLRSCDRVNYRGSWLSFIGQPRAVGDRCRILEVDAVECEPCCGTTG